MSKLTWDKIGERLYETGTKRECCILRQRTNKELPNIQKVCLGTV